MTMKMFVLLPRLPIKMIRVVLPAMLLLICCEVSGQQLDFNNCKSYTQINASNYDRNPSSSNPLGYYASTLPYMDGKKVTPCVHVTGIPSTAYIEIKSEMDTNGARICVGDEGGTLRECGNGRLRSCSLATATAIKFAFYCDTACEQVDVPFWYRFVMSEAKRNGQRAICFHGSKLWNQFEYYIKRALSLLLFLREDQVEQSDISSENVPSDQWCENRPSDDYPSSLITAPPNVVTPPATKKVKGRGSICEPFIYLIFFSTMSLLASMHSSW